MHYFKMLALRSSPPTTAANSIKFTGKKILAVVHLSGPKQPSVGKYELHTPFPVVKVSLIVVKNNNDEALLSKNIKPMPIW